MGEIRNGSDRISPRTQVIDFNLTPVRNSEVRQDQQPSKQFIVKVKATLEAPITDQSSCSAAKVSMQEYPDVMKLRPKLG